MTLFNITAYPLVGFEIYNHIGKKVKVKARCELCAFSKINEDDNSLTCLIANVATNDNHWCIGFNVTTDLVDDIYMGMIK